MCVCPSECFGKKWGILGDESSVTVDHRLLNRPIRLLGERFISLAEERPDIFVPWCQYPKVRDDRSVTDGAIEHRLDINVEGVSDASRSDFEPSRIDRTEPLDYSLSASSMFRSTWIPTRWHRSQIVAALLETTGISNSASSDASAETDR